MPVTRAITRAGKASATASPSPRRITDSPIRQVRESRPPLRRQRRLAAVLFPSPAAAAAAHCRRHNLPCTCASSVRPTDPSLYYGNRCLPSNRVTERYVMANLSLTQRQLDFTVGLSLALKDAIANAAPRIHTVQQHGSSGLFRILTDNDVVCLPSLILPLLLVECVVVDIDLQDLLNDPFQPTPPADDSLWLTIDLDLCAPWNLTLADPREFLAGYIAPLIIRLLQLSSGPVEREIAQRLIAGIPYFRYLAIRTGFMSVSTAKRNAWETAVLARKVQVLWTGRSLVAPVAVAPYGEIAGGAGKVQEIATELERQKMLGANRDVELENIRFDLSRIEKSSDENHRALFTMHTELGDDVAGIRGLAEVDMRKIQQDNHDLFEMQHELKDDVARMETIGENNQSDLLKIREDVSDITMQVSNITTQVSEIKEVEKTITSQITEIKEAEKTITSQITEIQSTLESRLATTVEHSLEKYTQLMTTKIDQLVSANRQEPLPTELPIPAPSDHCDLQVHLRLRNTSNTSIDLVSGAKGLHRAYTAGEPTDVVSRAVTRGLSSRTPFIVAVAGFSGGGKSYNTFSAGGLLHTILGYLPDVEISVTEVLVGATYLCGFQYAAGTATQEVCSKIGATITRKRTTRVTPANSESSRAHMVVTFEDKNTGWLYGVLLDIAGDEESADRELLQDEKAVSNSIALNNADWRRMLRELTTPGVGVQGFVGGAGVSNYKRVSKLNSEVAGLLARMVGQKEPSGKAVKMPIVRVLYCVDGGAERVVSKSVQQVNDLCEAV